MNEKRVVFQDRSSPRKRVKHTFQDLLNIAAQAAKIRPPLYISSILGHPWAWIPPHRRYSEYGIVDPWRMRRTIKYLLNVSIPSLPRTPPNFIPPFLDDLFWEPTVILQRPDHNGSYTTFPDEAWFFINGIMTNDSVAQLNAAFISYLFRRPLTLIQNSTNSFFVDMAQCAIGKEWDLTTEPAAKAFPPIYDALKSEKEKVVVVAHSQGTIIMATVLDMLNAITRREQKEEAPIPVMMPHMAPAAEAAPSMTAFGLLAPEAGPQFAGPEFIYPDQGNLKLGDFEPLEEAELAKLELYCFANCANDMKYFRPPQAGQNPVPWIENFGNEFDLVARLGMLAPDPDQLGIDIDGPSYERPGAWGHLLNEHYLFGIEEYQKAGQKKGGAGGSAPFKLVNGTTYPGCETPRLFGYINGGSSLDR
jgi:hypothetical protein